MAYYTASLYASVEMFLVLTSSLANGPIVGFSGSFTATKPAGAPAWAANSQSIAEISQLNLISSSLSGSDLNNYVFVTSASTHVNIRGECEKILSAFTGSADIVAIFSSMGINLI